MLAPDEEAFKRYRKDKDWTAYEAEYCQLLTERNAAQKVDESLFRDGAVLLCSEPTAEYCHRRLASEHLRNEIFHQANIIHL